MLFWHKKPEKIEKKEKQKLNLLRNVYSTVIANNIYWDETCTNSIESTEEMCFDNMTQFEMLAMIDYLLWLKTGDKYL